MSSKSKIYTCKEFIIAQKTYTFAKFGLKNCVIQFIVIVIISVLITIFPILQINTLSLFRAPS